MLNARINDILAAVDVPADLHSDIAAAVAADLGAAGTEVAQAELVDCVYFHVFSDPDVRRAVNYHHPLDACG